MTNINIEQANQKAIDEFMNARPILVGVEKAVDVIPGMHKNLYLHAGPPCSWERMSGPVKGGMIGAIIFEGRAKNAEEAESILSSGKIEFAPCNDYDASGPMAGIISPSMMVFVVEDKNSGYKTFSGMNEGRGKVLRMGAYSEEVIERMLWLNNVLAPTVDAALKAMNGLDIRTLLAKALHMGDDGHNRLDAASLLFTNLLAPHIIRTAKNSTDAADVVKFLGENALAVLNPVMAGCKTMANAAQNIEGSTIVTLMARNGTDWGIKVSGMGNQWFTAPAPVVKALYFPGFTEKDACLDIGDSVIMETVGIGGFAMATAPALVTFIGGTPRDAINTTLDMYEITYGEHKNFTIPFLDFRGTPTGIDIRKVIEKGITPRVNTGVAHKDPGIGQVGAGVVSAPMKLFEDALVAFAEKYDI
ncbi:MAG: DUF1116 domain-containing protein [Anaerolineaceae bacterium]|nr:DUF1116 domain-containing protein [Anaerolineaceae bacterium]